LEGDYFRIFGGTEIPVVYETPYNLTVNLGNGESLNVPEGSTNFTVLYNLSGYYNITISAVGYPSTNSTSKAIIWITEEEADAIAEQVYDSFNLIAAFDNLFQTGATSPNHFNITVDHFETDRNIGDEYITPNDPDENERLGYPSNWKEQLNSVIDNCNGPEYIKPIDPCTASEYNATLIAYLNYLKNVCHAFTKKIKEKPKIGDHKNINSISQDIPEQQETTVKKIEQVSKSEKPKEEIQLIRQPNLGEIRIIKKERKSFFNLISEFFENIFSIV